MLNIMTNMQKNKGLIDLGYTVAEVELLMDVTHEEIRQCTRQARNIDLTLNNDALLKQYEHTAPAKIILTREREEVVDKRKRLKLLVNKISGTEEYKEGEYGDID